MSHGGTEEEVEQRIGLAQGAVNQLQLGRIWTSRRLPLPLQLRVLKSRVASMDVNPGESRRGGGVAIGWAMYSE